MEREACVVNVVLEEIRVQLHDKQGAGSQHV